MEVEEEYALASEVAGRMAPDERYKLFRRFLLFSVFLFFQGHQGALL